MKEITIEIKVEQTQIKTTCSAENAATVIENISTFMRSLLENREIMLGGEVKNPLPIPPVITVDHESKNRVEKIWAELFQCPAPPEIQNRLTHKNLNYTTASQLSDPDLVDLLCQIKQELTKC